MNIASLIRNVPRAFYKYLMMFMLMIAIALIVVYYRGADYANQIFEDVSLTSGISYRGMTYGAAWGDFDGDRLPDLYVTNHVNPGSLYRNLGDGHFVDVTQKYISHQEISADKHGAAWADFDNDGDQDLIVLRGGGRGVGSEQNYFYINEGVKFEEKAQALNITNPYARARSPLWYDFNRDGLLDLLLGAFRRKDGLAPATIYLQSEGIFEESSDIAAFATGSVPFCIITELNQDEVPEMVCRVMGSHDRTAHIFSTEKLPLTELNLFPATHFDDLVAGDFNGDQLLDLYLARSQPASTVLLASPGVSQLIADMEIKLNQDEKKRKAGFRFHSAGELKLKLVSTYPRNSLTPDQVYIGSRGVHPNGLSFILSRELSGITEKPSSDDGSHPGIFINLTPPDEWKVLFVGSDKVLSEDPEKHQQVTIKIDSTEAITGLKAIPESLVTEQPPDRLLINSSMSLHDETKKSGINAQLSASVNTVSGDFDNDMDVDIYIVVSDHLVNQDNILLLNDGHGKYISAPNAGGASGSKSGVGDSVVTADYDLDGFLDLLVVNGGSMGRSFGLPAEDGGYQLYHNMGNENHWIEIDLAGTKSNRDGIGALVYVSAGGVTQVRMQDGGIHQRGQNHQRLHFGLGKYKKTDMIRIHWPSGTRQVLEDVQADQLMLIQEPS